MSGFQGSRSHRTRGSWIPRLTGVGVVVVVAAGGLTAYLAANHSAVPRHEHHPPHHAPTLSSKVLKAQTVGLIDFGPDDDGDPFQNDPDDHPLMLRPTPAGLSFVTVPRSEVTDGSPQWTVNQMAGGTMIFIYAKTGKCLNAGKALVLAHCNLGIGQRWTPVHPMTELGQAFAAYRNDKTGTCLTAPPAPKEHQPADPGPAKMAACGPARDKSQEIAFWWGP